MSGAADPADSPARTEQRAPNCAIFWVACLGECLLCYIFSRRLGNITKKEKGELGEEIGSGAVET
jgi:hypothetical protein